MKITVEVEVFDDPKYCESGTGWNDTYCDYLDIDECGLFPKAKALQREIIIMENEDEDYVGPREKCDQCKAEYQKQKEADANQ